MSRDQNHWVAPRSTQPFILPNSIKWAPGICGNWMVKSKLSPRSGIKRGHKVFFKKTTLFFRKLCFSLRTSYKELICCTKNSNVHIFTFCKRWSFTWRCFFPVSILKTKTNSSFALKVTERSNPSFLLSIWWITFFRYLYDNRIKRT